ncbi:transcobalamin-2 [Eublepharis macularius]|uniref:Transcobalamin-2 n=1 Tax=Eublepharis macularius TaxID=481883 RepID=A0AA97KCE8_EUBMA|nr:transcobalamin-2 [Eublepharis macularius]XP_054852897.1 transcobalamin-2 [Eublepharis macularius]XP_054852898.1 transcobalamin-2 [Eublepharis macularius]XP_054852899.1 transcobalamin-2 [Eublepharis macularius]
MAPPRWLLVFVLHSLFGAIQLCEIPSGNTHRIKSLNTELLKLTEDVSKDPNPSVYLGLRLSAYHIRERESLYLQRLKEVFQPDSSSIPFVATYQEQPSTGQLALYLLVLRAACQDMEMPVERQLVTQLKLHLHREKESLVAHENNSRPLTNFYQYSLGILTLCVHHKKVDVHVIKKLLSAEKHGRFEHESKLFVDTEAMSGLAFVCLQRATFYTPELVAELNQAVQRVKQKILQAQNPDGTFGNIYSSPLAVQFLIAAGVRNKEPECPKGMAALLGKLEEGRFQNPLVGSQLLPVLHGKSYVDIANMECPAEEGTVEETKSLVLDTSAPEPRVTSQGTKIAIHLIVKQPPRRLPLYNEIIRVPGGSSLLDVLQAAKKRSFKPFSFETEETLSGPMLTSVMGVKAMEGQRKYWKIIRFPHTSVEQGIADYIPQDEESIILKFSPW